MTITTVQTTKHYNVALVTLDSYAAAAAVAADHQLADDTRARLLHTEYASELEAMYGG